MHTRSRTLSALTAVAALLVTSTIVAGNAAGAGSRPAPATPFPSDWPNQFRLSEAASTISAAAQQRYPEVYAGVELDVPGDVVIVHRRPTAGFDEAIAALVPGVTVRFAYSPHSEAQVTAWQERVVADQTYWRSRGITLNGIGPRFGQCVVVQVDDPERDRLAIVTHYPDWSICVEQGGPAVPLVGAPG
jgi:hypothetical protein